jgi:hypothetical protein
MANSVAGGSLLRPAKDRMARAESRAHKPAFILLCGCPRSGTTLVSRHLGSALNIAVPDETHFIPHFRRYLRLWGNLDDPAIAPSLGRDLLQSTVCSHHCKIPSLGL